MKIRRTKTPRDTWLSPTTNRTHITTNIFENDENEFPQGYRM